MAVSIDKGKLIDQAQKYIQKGQFDKAISEYQKVVEADSKDIRSRLKLGELYLKVGNNASAVNEYSAAAESYASDGFILQAIDVFKQLLKIDPSISDIYVKLAKLYKKQGLIADALAQYRIVIANYEKLLSAKPASREALRGIGEAYLETGKIKKALDSLKAALKSDPNDTTALSLLSRVYLELDDEQNAKLTYKNILRIDPSSDDARKGLTKLLIKEGKGGFHPFPE